MHAPTIEAGDSPLESFQSALWWLPIPELLLHLPFSPSLKTSAMISSDEKRFFLFSKERTILVHLLSSTKTSNLELIASIENLDTAASNTWEMLGIR
mmetsp:Transcript_35126/g.71615  ORF Transcript_35126/g.71615 Transcript_35126/m.71615 type:complete len:97 (-) Transcript_35126:40-330(-)